MNIETQCVHQGNLPDSSSGGITSPIFVSSAYDYTEQAEVLYPRYFNTPNQKGVASKIAALEGGQAGMVFSSGMAAISTAILAFLESGDHVVFQKNLYGGTTHMINRELAKFGIRFSYVTPTIEAIEAACRPETRMIFIETPSNPHLQLTDIEAVVAIAKERGLLTVIDNTFASPINQKPLSMGIDISTHSGTKYLGGHSDLCCGAVVTSMELMQSIQASSVCFGGSLDARVCYLLERSLKTLALRVTRQNQVAMAIARYLEQHPAVARVHYPGLESHPQFSLAKRQMTGFGGMLSFELAAGALSGSDLKSRLKLISPAVSLGGVETTICSPVLTSHAKLTAEERAEQGITDRLLRLSSGIEAPQDLIADLEQALGA